MDGHRESWLAPPTSTGVGMTRTLLDVMTEFRAATSARALIEQAPEAIAHLGFDRVLLSRIDQGVWLPETMFVRRDPRWATAIVQAGCDQPTSLDTVVETDVVATAATLVVDEVQTNPRVCRPIAVVSRSDNYGVAPIVVERAVIGMVHADCFFQRRAVHREECDALAVAAENLAAHLGRLLLLDHLQQIRQAPGRLWPTRAANPEPRAELNGCELIGAELTTREVEVIRLMAAGETNYRIARLLDITEGTAKTHVSNILQKLDASNRAQAVSRWLRT